MLGLLKTVMKGNNLCVALNHVIFSTFLKLKILTNLNVSKCIPLAHYIACPSGWEKWNGNCYLLQPEVDSMVFDAAEQGCVNRGGHLASINSNEELDFIQG